MHQPTDSPAGRNDDFDLGYLLAVFVDYRYFIAAVALLVALAGTAYAMLATPIYRADALLQIESRHGNGGAALELAMFGQQAGTAATQGEILRSRMVMGPAAQQAGLDLVVTPDALPFIGGVLQRSGMKRPRFAQGWPSVWAGENIVIRELNVEDALTGRSLDLQVLPDGAYAIVDQTGRRLGVGRVNEWLRLDSPALELLVSEMNAPENSLFTLRKRSEAEMANYLRRRFDVQERGRRDSGVLEISLTGPDRDEITRSINAIADVYVLQNINRQAAEAESRLRFLEEQTPQVQQVLNSAEDALNQYRATQDSVDLSFETRSMLEALVQVESELNNLDFQETEVAQRYTPSHPTYRSLLERRAQLEHQRTRLDARVENLPETQRQVLRLNRDVEVSQQVYMQMLNSMQELRVARAGTIGNVRILDRGLASGMIAPQRFLVIVASVIAGLVLGVTLVLLRHMLKRGVHSVEQIQALGMPVYATVPFSYEQLKLDQSGSLLNRLRRRSPASQLRLLALADSADLAVEALRGLRTSLQLTMQSARNNCLMLASPDPDAGKGFIAANLAVVCAQAGQKVLLVDADLRKGQLHDKFQHTNGPGLAELLAGEVDLENVLGKTGSGGLDFVPRGTIPRNPSELLMSSRFEDFLGQVSHLYDLVILDTAPVLAVTDPAVVGRHAGTALLLARYEQTSPGELEVAARQLRTAGVEVAGVILNAVQRSARAYYSYGYYPYSYRPEIRQEGDV